MTSKFPTAVWSLLFKWITLNYFSLILLSSFSNSQYQYLRRIEDEIPKLEAVSLRCGGDHLRADEISIFVLLMGEHSHQGVMTDRCGPRVVNAKIKTY